MCSVEFGCMTRLINESNSTPQLSLCGLSGSKLFSFKYFIIWILFLYLTSWSLPTEQPWFWCSEESQSEAPFRGSVAAFVNSSLASGGGSCAKQVTDLQLPGAQLDELQIPALSWESRSEPVNSPRLLHINFQLRTGDVIFDVRVRTGIDLCGTITRPPDGLGNAISSCESCDMTVTSQMTLTSFDFQIIHLIWIIVSH